MGIRSAFKFAAEVASSKRARTPIASPWSTGNLAKVVYTDIFGTSTLRATRAEAMKVSAIVKGRALICGTLSRQPLVKYRGEAKIDAEPWMYRTNTAQAPRSRMLWTLDDVIFHGSSLWAVERGARDQILDAIRVPLEWWEVDDDLRVTVNGQFVSPEEVIIFEGPQDGLLDIAADDIAAARSMGKAWADRVEHPAPPAVLTSTDQNADLETGEARELVKEWDEARKAGGTAYLPAGLNVQWPDTATADLYVQGRNASRLDFANYLALPAALLEGTTATASLTYSTKEGSRNELVDYSLAYWANPIEARLSQDDVVPAGTRTQFDLEYLTIHPQPTQGPAHED